MIIFIPSNSNEYYTQFSQLLMEEAFPLCERPSFDDIIQRDSSIFHACTIMREDKPVGLFNYWRFTEFDYIEHFAIDSKLRNNGIGVTALQQFLNNNNRLVVLEAELPTNELAKRRIKFYQRNGFHVNPQPYIQPAYRPQGETLEMSILSTQKLDDNLFETIKNKIYQSVYNQT